MVNEQKLLEAYNSVKFHGANKRIAAEKSGVSCSTLRKRLKNGNKNKSTSHEKQMNFTLAEEDLISHWIISENAMGRVPTDKEIRDFGIKLASAHGRSIILGIHWSERFRSRRPELQEILGTKLGHSRGKAMNSEELPRFFEILKNLLKEYKIKRENIYNMDEAGIDVVDIQDCQKVTGPSYVIRSYITSPTKRPRVSVIECICADGTCIDPLVIYRGNKEMERYTPQDIENTPKWEYYIDSSAWTNGIITQAWLENVFIPQTKPDDINQWRLLIMDNSLSHCTTNFKKKGLKQ